MRRPRGAAPVAGVGEPRLVRAARVGAHRARPGGRGDARPARGAGRHPVGARHVELPGDGGDGVGRRARGRVHRRAAAARRAAPDAARRPAAARGRSRPCRRRPRCSTRRPCGTSSSWIATGSTASASAWRAARIVALDIETDCGPLGSPDEWEPSDGAIRLVQVALPDETGGVHTAVVDCYRVPPDRARAPAVPRPPHRRPQRALRAALAVVPPRPAGVAGRARHLRRVPRDGAALGRARRGVRAAGGHARARPAARAGHRQGCLRQPSGGARRSCRRRSCATRPSTRRPCSRSPCAWRSWHAPWAPGSRCSPPRGPPAARPRAACPRAARRSTPRWRSCIGDADDPRDLEVAGHVARTVSLAHADRMALRDAFRSQRARLLAGQALRPAEAEAARA